MFATSFAKCASKEKTECPFRRCVLTSNFPTASPHVVLPLRKLCLMIQESALAGVFRLLFVSSFFFLIPNLLKS